MGNKHARSDGSGKEGGREQGKAARDEVQAGRSSGYYGARQRSSERGIWDFFFFALSKEDFAFSRFCHGLVLEAKMMLHGGSSC